MDVIKEFEHFVLESVSGFFFFFFFFYYTVLHTKYYFKLLHTLLYNSVAKDRPVAGWCNAPPNLPKGPLLAIKWAKNGFL